MRHTNKMIASLLAVVLLLNLIAATKNGGFSMPLLPKESGPNFPDTALAQVVINDNCNATIDLLSGNFLDMINLYECVRPIQPLNSYAIQNMGNNLGFNITIGLCPIEDCSEGCIQWQVKNLTCTVIEPTMIIKSVYLIRDW